MSTINWHADVLVELRRIRIAVEKTRQLIEEAAVEARAETEPVMRAAPITDEPNGVTPLWHRYSCGHRHSTQQEADACYANWRKEPA